MTPATKSLIAIACGGALAVAGLCAFVAARPQTAASAPTAAPALTVQIETPQSAAWARSLAANGSVAAWQEASVGVELAGLRLSEVRVNVGDEVRRGEVLAVFADDTVTAELAQAQANLAAAEARLAEATVNADSARRLRNTGALSEQQILQLITAEQTAQAQLAVQRAATQAAQVRLRQTRVLAADDGLISARTATVGAVVPAGQELFRLIRQGRLEWRAEVASHEITALEVGGRVRVQGPEGTGVPGTVRRIAPNVDPRTRLGLVYVDLPHGTALKAGMFARGELDLGEVPVLTLPRQAVVLRDGFSYVFGLGADRRVSQIKVQTGRRQGDRIEIIGIAADARLVASGAGFLNDGDFVKVIERPGLLARNRD